jgi:hypothetical protein
MMRKRTESEAKKILKAKKGNKKKQAKQLKTEQKIFILDIK